MIITDTHCDTLCRIADEGGELFSNKFHVDIKRMLEYDGYFQVFACYISDRYENGKKRFLELTGVFERETGKNKKYLNVCRDYFDYKKTVNESKCGAFLSIENSSFIKSAADIDLIEEKGVMMASLTWNNSNQFAGGADDNITGLTMLGKDYVKELEKRNIIIDVSHLNEKSFWDVMRTVSKPVVASHSNLYTVCPHPRNLKNEQFYELIKTGGYVGLNFYPEFLAKDGHARAKDVSKMAEKAFLLGGEDVIGLGGDFDGIDKTPDKINGIQSLNEIFEYIKDKNMAEKLANGNFELYLRNNI